MDTKENIIIDNIMVYTDKKTNEVKTRIGFKLTDEKHFSNSDKFVGYSELSCFYDGNLIKKISPALIKNKVVVLGIFEIRPNQSNPMRTSSILSAIEYKGNVYTLL